MSTNYEAIRQKNIKEYGEGTRHLSYLADIYSTRTHFIFEVLQNAEDALSRRPAGSAGYVHFHLHDDRLEIRHNGAPFTESNVTGICGIGEGTKAGDFTQIGKFGIGFKSVYAYTFFPQIHCNSEHFEVRRFVEPHAIPPIENTDTLIILPFDDEGARPEWAFRESVSAADAVREIGDAIRKLGIRTLLFLRHIEEIKWTLADGISGQFIRNSERITGDNEPRKVEVLDQDDHLEEWRIFERKLEVQDAGKPQQVTVEIAYLFTNGAITRADNTELVVFFPTEKKTELGFLVQAPFKATKARDNIKSDEPANRQMIEAAAELAADSLETLRDLGLLNVGSFNALPLWVQDFPEGSLFRPVYEKVREALKTKELLPADGGGFVCANHAKLARGKELVKLFSSEQLDELFDGDGLKWLSDSITESGTTLDLHSCLKNIVEEVSPEKLKVRLIPTFFEAQSEEWLIRFYAYITKNFGVFKDTPFVRREDGQHVAVGTVEKPNIYFPPANVADINQDIFPLVKTTLASDSEVAKFLRETAKLREPNKVDVVIQCTLQKYLAEGLASFNEESYAKVLNEISVAFSNVESADATRLINKLKETTFVVAVPAGDLQGKRVLVKPSDPALYRQSSDLEQWFSGNETYKAWFPLPVVGLHLANDIQSKLGFANASLVIRSSPSAYRRSEGGFDAGANIFGLEWAVSHPNHERAVFLWDKLLENVALIQGKELRSRNKQFPKDSTKEINGFSTLGKACTDHAWLPQADKFCRPNQLLLSELPDGFERTTPRAESLARALGMKQPVDLTLIAKANGITPEEVQRRMSVTPEEMAEIERSRQVKLNSPSLPDKRSPDPQRRANKVAEEAENAPAKTREARERTVNLDYPEAQSDARGYLKGQYKNEDRIMFCQICQAPQPVLLNREPYFEAVNCVGDINAHHEQNNLALCPNHAAMYKKGGLTPDTVRRAILECEGQKIPLNLAGNEVELYFTQQHLGDLRAVLSVLDSERN